MGAERHIAAASEQASSKARNAKPHGRCSGSYSYPPDITSRIHCSRAILLSPMIFAFGGYGPSFFRLALSKLLSGSRQPAPQGPVDCLRCSPSIFDYLFTMLRLTY